MGLAPFLVLYSLFTPSYTIFKDQNLAWFTIQYLAKSNISRYNIGSTFLSFHLQRFQIKDESLKIINSNWNDFSKFKNLSNFLLTLFRLTTDLPKIVWGGGRIVLQIYNISYIFGKMIIYKIINCNIKLLSKKCAKDNKLNSFKQPWTLKYAKIVAI